MVLISKGCSFISMTYPEGLTLYCIDYSDFEFMEYMFFTSKRLSNVSPDY